MNLHEKVGLGAGGEAIYKAGVGLDESIPLPRAKAEIIHRRPDGKGGWIELSREISHNVITNSGRDFLHQQGYQTSGLGSNGLNYIGLSNDTVTETATSTTLSNEIAANGLARAQGVVSHTAGTNTTSIANTFTCATSSQSCQKAALFTAASNGTMCHVLGFTQRTLQVGDQIVITYTITLG